MGHDNIDQFIDKLSSELKPIRKLLPLKWRIPLFIIGQILIVTVLFLIYSSLSNQTSQFYDHALQNPYFLIQVILILLTWISASAVTLLSTLPGRFKRVYLLFPSLCFISLLISVFLNYWDLEQISHSHRAICMVEISLLAIAPFFFMIQLLKKGFFISKRLSMTLGSFSCALFPALIMHFMCNTHPMHVLIFHFLPVFIFSFLGAYIWIKLNKSK